MGGRLVSLDGMRAEMPQDQRPLEGASAQEDPTASDGRAVVAFDFDGTLTIRDSFTAFLRWRAGPIRYALGLLRLAPAAAAYLFNRDRGRIKAAAAGEFLRGVSRERLEADALRFAQLFSRRLLRPDAVAAWKRWRGEPVRLVIVTASPDLVVAPFAWGLGADALLGTAVVFDESGRVAAPYLGANCRGPAKVARLQAAFGAQVTIKAAYGDTAGDREMLALSPIAGYRVFSGRP